MLAALATLGVFGVRARARVEADRDGATAATRTDRPRVLVTKAERAPARVEQILPGSAAPLFQTAIYARTSGYLKRWLVDIGDTVKEGQLLAEIETPEVDAQLLQARAALAEAEATVERDRANEALSRVNLGRVRRVIDSGAGSSQDLDASEAAAKVATATVGVSEATISAGRANVKRLEDLQRFQRVTAPFGGVVTARNFDAGALMVADNAAAKELFHVARIDTIRVFADVPQTFATGIRPGHRAPVFRREVPGREFPGTVARTTNAIDPTTRTLRVEVDVPNPDGALLPGMYLQVRFSLEAPAAVVRVPGAAVITRADGAKVALVGEGQAVRYRPVTVGRDYGTTVDLVSGLTGGETLIIRPGDDLPDGTVVEPVTPSGR
jgi:RND family efflux transporter MFP subunit